MYVESLSLASTHLLFAHIYSSLFLIVLEIIAFNNNTRKENVKCIKCNNSKVSKTLFESHPT
jgi:hypothetical protein